MQVVGDESGTVRTVRLDDQIVETVYEGKMQPEMLHEIQKDLDRLMRSQPGSSWLADTTKTTGYAMAPRPLTEAVLATFQRHGGKRIAVVMPSSGLRMLVTAVAFATGLPIRLFATRDEALGWLRGR